jgi:hypothetical protein
MGSTAASTDLKQGVRRGGVEGEHPAENNRQVGESLHFLRSDNVAGNAAIRQGRSQPVPPRRRVDRRPSDLAEEGEMMRPLTTHLHH